MVVRSADLLSSTSWRTFAEESTRHPARFLLLPFQSVACHSRGYVYSFPSFSLSFLSQLFIVLWQTRCSALNSNFSLELRISGEQRSYCTKRVSSSGLFFVAFSALVRRVSASALSSCRVVSSCTAVSLYFSRNRPPGTSLFLPKFLVNSFLLEEMP